MEVSTENTGKKSRTLSYETIRDRKITTCFETRTEREQEKMKLKET